MLFFTFVALIEGFTITHLKLGDIKFERVYLKWDNRLHIKASLIDLSELKSDDEPINLQPLQHLPTIIKHSQEWIDTIDIQKLRYKDSTILIRYNKNARGKITLHNSKIDLNGSFNLNPETLELYLDTPPVAINKFSAKLSVEIPKKSFTLTTNLSLPNTPLLTGYLRGDDSQLYLQLKADREFNQIATIVDFIGVDPIVRPWIVEYAKFKSASLLSCIGRLNYDKPQNFLESLHIHAKATQGEYTFDPSIAPIKAPNVDIYFETGKLHIIPHDGMFYTLPAERSHLNIDFMTPHVMLNAFIKSSHAQLNNDILFLLNHYKIKVPVRQNIGTSDVDLNLSINLHDISISAHGQFIPKPSEIELDGFIFKTTGGKVILNDTNIDFYGFDADYGSLASAHVNGSFNATKRTGKINIIPTKCTPTNDPNNISMITADQHPKIVYLINPTQDLIEIYSSIWNVYGDTLVVEPVKIPFDFSNKHTTIPKLPFQIPNKLSGYLKGELSIKNWLFSLNFDKFDNNALKLLSKSFILNVSPKDNSIIISSPNASSWDFSGETVTLSSMNLINTQSSLIFNNINMIVKDQMSASLNGSYQKNKNIGVLALNDAVVINPQFKSYIDPSTTQNITFHTSKESIDFHSKNFGIDLKMDNEGWLMDIPDISFLSKSSPLLSRYKVNKGKIALLYSNEDKRVTFNGNVEYPYRLMMVNNKPLSNYRFSGSFENGKTFIRINDRFNVTDNGILLIRANNMGINAPELLRWLNDHQTTTSDTQKSSQKTVKLIANNVNLYLMENRKVISDTITATLDDDGLEGRLTQGNGSADILMKESLFYVDGRNFSDRFMENIFAFSDFDGGNLSFKIAGKSDQFEGVIRIDDVILKEYKVLNNVLSFINTIPSLTTFSLPNYNTKGLYVKDTYAHFSYQNHLFNIDNYTLNSAELKIVGNAKANMIEDTLNGTMTLKTDLGTTLGKVPMVGYILLGDDGSISTTLNLKGKLSDPIVETGIAKEIVGAPFNILKRTITYPFLWMIPDEKKK